MFTIKYKSGYINGYCNKKECTILFNGSNVKCKTLISAKRLITKLMKYPTYENYLKHCTKKGA